MASIPTARSIHTKRPDADRGTLDLSRRRGAEDTVYMERGIRRFVVRAVNSNFESGQTEFFLGRVLRGLSYRFYDLCPYSCLPLNQDRFQSCSPHVCAYVLP